MLVPAAFREALTKVCRAADKCLRRHRVSRRRARWSLAPSCRATQLDRAKRTAVARQGVWHARGSCATAEGVMPAVVCGDRFR